MRRRRIHRKGEFSKRITCCVRATDEPQEAALQKYEAGKKKSFEMIFLRRYLASIGEEEATKEAKFCQEYYI